MFALPIIVPKEVKNDFKGLSFLNEVFFKMQYHDHTGIILDFSKTTWFEANLTSVLGTVINFAKSNDKTFEVISLKKPIYDVFKRNGFLDYYNLGKEVDLFNSTIEYKVFDVDDVDLFAEYVSENVVPKIRITIDNPIKKKFNTSLNEVFVNVGMHAKSKSVFTCGQYYHTHKKVAFTIVDIGNTIPFNIKKINEYEHLSDTELINWATIYGNTTRKDKSVGGIGLNIIDEFLSENNGIFQIISGTGFWEKNAGNLHMSELSYHFPGTIVNIITKLEGTMFYSNDEVLF